jgi:hypothetical protein
MNKLHLQNGYHGETRHDDKMGRGKLRDTLSSAQNAIRKHRANRKRRQRDDDLTR